ncbi:MAG TPA: hypothetical protein VF845_08480 [Terriglobales bacterium]
MFAKIDGKVQLSMEPALFYPQDLGFCGLSQGFVSSAVEPSGVVLA